MSAIQISESRGNNGHYHNVAVDGHPLVDLVALLGRRRLQSNASAFGGGYQPEFYAEFHIVDAQSPQGDANEAAILEKLQNAGIAASPVVARIFVKVAPKDLEAALVALEFDEPAIEAMMGHQAIALQKAMGHTRMQELLGLMTDGCDNLAALEAKMTEYRYPQEVISAIGMQAVADGLVDAPQAGVA